MKKKLVCLLCLMCLLLPNFSCALNEKGDIICNIFFRQDSFDHDFFLEYVLFGRKFTEKYDPSYWNPDQKMNHLNIIEYASYFCVDQFNNGNSANYDLDQKKLERLRKYVGGLPARIDEINPNENDKIQRLTPRIHRSFTHRGWDFPYAKEEYGGDIAKSKVRQRILLRSVDNVFDFYTSDDNLFERGIASISGKTLNDYRCRSYAKLIYYIHILGDCYEDKNYKQANGQDNGQKIPLGREHPGKTIETSDLIIEIMNVCEELFATSETNQDRYSLFKIQLEKEKRDISALYSQTGQIDSDEDYVKYHERVCSLMGVLMTHLPKLLRNERDFAEAFREFIDFSK